MLALFNIGDIISEGLYGIVLILDTIIYGLISSAYKIFMAIAGARLLSSEVYYDIANRLYVIVGVVMLFVLSYAILKAIIDPDQGTKGELGPKMIKRIIIAVIGLAVAPVLFNVMYQAQGLLLENDVIGKIIFRSASGDEVEYGDQSTNPNDWVDSIGGAVAATSIWQAFFHPADGYTADQVVSDPSEYYDHAVGMGVLCVLGLVGAGAAVILSFGTASLLAAGAAVGLCAYANGAGQDANNVNNLTNGEELTLEQAYAITSSGESFDIYVIFIDNIVEDGEVEYLWGVSTIAGAFALYAFISFSIDMGIRAAKLAYFQIIAPVPLVMQVLPKFKDNFSKYIKSVTSTFLEVFIRISVVYIVVYIICHLNDVFSSVGAVWGNDSLSSPERLLAMAALIIGLITFCMQAPNIITETLGLPKGNMNLGIGKKLTDGGVPQTAAVLGSGGLAAVKNFRDNKGQGFWRRVSSTAGGFASGVARSAYSQIGHGPGKRPVKNWRDVLDTMDRTTAKTTDAMNARVERNEARTAAETRLENAREALRTAIDNGDAAAIDAARAEYSKARTDFAQKAVPQVYNAGKAIDAYTVGTVSLAKEEAAMKFGSDLDSLKGKLRDEAYKKDDAARRLYTAYNNLKSEPIREYVEGWDEQSTNEEYRRRRAQCDELSSVGRQLEAARSRGDVMEAARLSTRYNELKSNVQGWGVTINPDGTMTGLDYSSLVGDLKVDVNQARIARDKEIEGLRMAMEAAADDFVRRKATDDSSNTYRDIATFLSDHASYIAANQDTSIVVDLDTGQKQRLGDAIATAFGSSAIDGKFTVKGPEAATFVSEFSSQSDIKVELPAGSAYGDSITYKLEGNSYVPYKSDGTRINDSTYGVYEKESFFDTIARKIADGVVKKASADTAVTRVADKGKASATHVRNTDYADKVARKRQAEDGKSGKK